MKLAPEGGVALEPYKSVRRWMDRIKALEKEVGAEDKQRLDQYFTGLRHLENQFNQQLTKPEPRPACVMPAAARSSRMRLPKAC